MKKERKLWIIAVIVTFFLGAAGMYLLYRYIPTDTTEIINKLEKEVTITDSGISESVEKLYDAVVVVQGYSKNTLISSGSGFVYKTNDDKAYILTNNHVIEKSSEIYVTFSNNEKVKVDLVGSEKYSDIAVLSVDADKILLVAKLGKSQTMKLGDTVFTVGAPIGSNYSGTVTRGILSGQDRMVEVSIDNTYSSDYVMKVIQTDAAINSGNSGGPLANSNGEVIGITSLKLVSSGVEGIGFAIPIEDVLLSASLIEKDGSITRPFLGVSMAEVSDAINQLRMNIPKDTVGIVIVEVENGSPASYGGLKSGFIITGIAGVKIESVAELKYQLYRHSPGEVIKIEYIDNGETKNTEVKLVASK